MDVRHCEICGKVFITDSPRKIFCSDECLRISSNRRKNESLKAEWAAYRSSLDQFKGDEREKPKMSIGEISVLAKKEGLSYGQYIVKYKL